MDNRFPRHSVNGPMSHEDRQSSIPSGTGRNKTPVSCSALEESAARPPGRIAGTSDMVGSEHRLGTPLIDASMNALAQSINPRPFKTYTAL